jgi:hypothetical protein
MGEVTHKDGLVVETRAIIEREIEGSIIYLNMCNVCSLLFLNRNFIGNGLICYSF